MDAKRRKVSQETDSEMRLQHLADEVKKLLVSPPPVRVEDPPSSRFTWTIENFSKLETEEHYSDFFRAGGYKWRLKIFPRGKKSYSRVKRVAHLSVDLLAADLDNLPYGWSRHAQFSVAIVNQIDNKKTVKEGRRDYQFNANNAQQSCWGLTSFMPLSELYNPARGYLVNDTCIVEAVVSVGGHTFRSATESMPVPETQTIQDGRRNEPAETIRVVKPSIEVKLEKQGLEPSPKVEDMSLLKNQRAGQLFVEGRHSQMDETYENIGGFSVLKAQASLYKQIWVKYGHIASSKVLSASYVGQVLIVAEIMKSIVEMHQSHLHELSTEIINTWEEKLKLAESLDFHVDWLQERLEEVKKDFHGMQKLEIELEGQRQSLLDAQARVARADDEVQKLQAELLAAKDELVRAQENKAVLESTVLADVEIFIRKGKSLLFEGLL